MAKSMILKKLENYGDSFLYVNKDASNSVNHKNTSAQAKKVSISSRKRKRRKNKLSTESECVEDNEHHFNAELSESAKSNKLLQEEFGFTESDINFFSNQSKATVEDKNLDPITGQKVEVVFYNAPPVCKKQKFVEKLKSSDLKSDNAELRRIQHEVRKFGIGGMMHNDKEKAKEDLAISLGAKPLKNKYVNYRELQELKKQDKTCKEDLDQVKALTSNSSNKNKSKRMKKKQNLVTGQMGRYVDGVQVLNSRHLTHIQKKLSRKK